MTSNVFDFFLGDQHWHSVIGWHVAIFIAFYIGWHLSHHHYRRATPPDKRRHR